MRLLGQGATWGTALHTISRWQQHDHYDSTSLIQHSRIPGGSPLRYCNESRSTDLYQIEQIELYPEPLHMCVSPPQLLQSP